ncbi:hypothetical protein BD289DRAFT_154594 [Coniella lustricola]|uniref:Uncharacterized protein n=1 Tax=Coniella lustricola TaxID=2025994 RepID=A0A2T3AMD2_9PEZI|nr:hypothetical protein BD289DRAFT_154594 [Coniella lustricola]
MKKRVARLLPPTGTAALAVLLTLPVLASAFTIPNPLTIPRQPELAIRSSTCGDSSYVQCGDSFPSDFCCPSTSTCNSLAGGTTVLCCPIGSNCTQIESIPCELSLEDKSQHPAAVVMTTALTGTLESCGSQCCPFGYSCNSDNVCQEKSDQSAKPSTSAAASSSTAAATSSSSGSKTTTTGTVSAGVSPTSVTGATVTSTTTSGAGSSSDTSSTASSAAADSSLYGELYRDTTRGSTYPDGAPRIKMPAANHYGGFDRYDGFNPVSEYSGGAAAGNSHSRSRSNTGTQDPNAAYINVFADENALSPHSLSPPAGRFGGVDGMPGDRETRFSDFRRGI